MAASSSSIYINTSHDQDGWPLAALRLYALSRPRHSTGRRPGSRPLALRLRERRAKLKSTDQILIIRYNLSPMTNQTRDNKGSVHSQIALYLCLQTSTYKKFPWLHRDR